MTNSIVIDIDADIDPWNKKPANDKPVPADIKLVCVYVIHVVIDTIDEAVFFRRTDSHDELWATLPDCQSVDATPDELRLNATSQGRVVRQVRAGSEEKAAAGLLKKHIRARAGHAWPTGFVRAGLIDRSQFDGLIEDLESGFRRVKKHTRENKAPIIKLAERLKLHPQPDNRSPGIWNAQCPAGSHFLLLNNKTNDFYCGYCARRGSASVLKAFKHGPRGKAGKVEKMS